MAGFGGSVVGRSDMRGLERISYSVQTTIIHDIAICKSLNHSHQIVFNFPVLAISLIGVSCAERKRAWLGSR